MSGPLPVTQLREAAALAAERTSLRRVAKRIGITHRSLAKFLEGANPRPATLRKLTAWFAVETLAPNRRAVERGRAAMSGDEAYMLLRSLVREFPPGRRTTVIRRLVDVLTDAYPKESLEQQWLTDLRRHLGPSSRSPKGSE